MAPPEQPEEERHLVRRCLQGDETAWQALQESVLPYVRNALTRKGIRREALEDACQELFVTLWEDRDRILGRFEGRSSLRHYLAIIAVRQALRARPVVAGKGPEGRLENLSDPDPAPLETLAVSERAQRLRSALSGLPERDLTLVQLVYLDGLRPGNAAKLLRIHPAYARVILHRALRRVRGRLPEVYFEGNDPGPRGH